MCTVLTLVKLPEVRERSESAVHRQGKALPDQTFQKTSRTLNHAHQNRSLGSQKE